MADHFKRPFSASFFAEKTPDVPAPQEFALMYQSQLQQTVLLGYLTKVEGFLSFESWRTIFSTK